MMVLLRLFYEFFKTGLFAVGGGLATFPFLVRMGGSTGWFTKSQLADMVAVSESTPGPLGVNMATYVGYTTAGVPGAVTATIGLVAPSVIVILLIAVFLRNFQDNRFVKSAFRILRPASTGLIAASGLSVAVLTFFGTASLSGASSVSWKAAALAALLLLLTRGISATRRVHPIVWIAASAAAGIVFQFAGV